MDFRSPVWVLKKSVNISILRPWFWTLGSQHSASSLLTLLCQPSCRMHHCSWDDLVRDADVTDVESFVRKLSDWVKSVHIGFSVERLNFYWDIQEVQKPPFCWLAVLLSTTKYAQSLRRSLLRLEAELVHGSWPGAQIMESPPSHQGSQILGTSKHSMNRLHFFCDSLLSLMRQEENHKANRLLVGLEPGAGEDFPHCLALWAFL